MTGQVVELAAMVEAAAAAQVVVSRAEAVMPFASARVAQEVVMAVV